MFQLVIERFMYFYQLVIERNGQIFQLLIETLPDIISFFTHYIILIYIHRNYPLSEICSKFRMDWRIFSTNIP